MVYLADANWLAAERARLRAKFKAAVRLVMACNFLYYGCEAHERESVAHTMLPGMATNSSDESSDGDSPRPAAESKQDQQGRRPIAPSPAVNNSGGLKGGGDIILDKHRYCKRCVFFATLCLCLFLL